MSLNVVMNQQGGLTAGHNQQAVNPFLNPQVKSNAVQYTTHIDNRAVPTGKASAIVFREQGTVPYVVEGRNNFVNQQIIPTQTNFAAVTGVPRYVEQRQAIPMIIEQRQQPVIMEQPQVQRIIVQRPQHAFIESNVSSGSQANLQVYQVEIERLQMLLREKVEECEHWKLQSMNREAHASQFVELQSRATFLQQENVRLTTLINEHIREMEQWRRRCFELEGLRGVVHDRERLEAENRHLSTMIQDMSGRVNIYETELNKNQQVQIIHGQEREFYESELQRLSEMLEIKNREIADWVMRFQQAEFEFHKSKELEQRIVVLGSEIERLHLILKTNLEEMDNYHQMITSLEARVSQVAALEARCLEQDAEIRRLRDSIEEWISKYSKLELLVGAYDGNESKLRALSLEIERLNSILIVKQKEIDELHVRHSSYKQPDYSSFETKIALLSQEIERLKSVNNQKESDLARMHDELLMITRETEEWRTRYSRLEMEKHGSLPEYENRIALLTQEIERLKQMVRFKEEDLSRLATDYERLEAKLRENSNTRTTITEYETKLALLSQEIERLNNMLRVKDEDISAWRSRYDQLEVSNRESASWKYKLTDYENKIALLSQEIERLNSLMRSKDDELYSFRSRYEQLEISSREMGGYKNQITNYENKIALLSQEVERLNSLLRTKDSDLYELKRTIQTLEVSSRESSSYQTQIREYENKLALLSQEIERLNSMLRTKDGDLYALRSKYESLEISTRELGTYQSRARDYETKLALLSQEIERLNSLLRSKDEEIRVKLSSWESVQTETIKYKKTISDYEGRIALLAQEIERLNVNLRNKDQELADFRTRYSSLEYRLQESSTSSIELQRLRGTITDYENKLALLSQEVERLNSLLRTKDSDLYELKRTIQTLEVSSRESSSYQVKLRDYENRIALLSQEIERLNTQMKSKNSEIEEWRYKYSSLESRNTQYSEEKMRYLVSEVDRLTSTLEANDRELSSYRSRFVDVSNLEKRLERNLAVFVLLCAEIENLRNKVIEKEAENETIRRTSFSIRR